MGKIRRNNTDSHARWDSLWVDGNLMTMDNHLSGVAHEETKGTEKQISLGLLADAAIAIKGDKIAWLRAMDELQAPYQELADRVYKLNRRWLSPGLIDCHTHLVYAGNRSGEFALRCQGADYAEILRHGGGIFDTVRATRQASENQLYVESAKRLRDFLCHGVTSLEIKSGYGLDHDTELRQLRVAKQLGMDFPVSVQSTYLGAHVIPAEMSAERYITFICQQMLPEIADLELATSVDIFCAPEAYQNQNAEQLFQAAQEYGFNLKIHAEQLSAMQSTQLAAQYGALSADHLEYLDFDGVKAMADANMVAVLLPGAYYSLQQDHPPPIQALQRFDVPIAIASDCNPGSSPLSSPLLCMNLACRLFGLSPEMALLGITRQAAKALGYNERGVLKPGYQADFAIWDVETPADLCYWMGNNPCYQVVKSGVLVYDVNSNSY